MVQFNVTNECLDAILMGITPTKEDRVLSVCGSGCIPFALLAYAGSVDAVDINHKQLDYAQEQLELLKQEDYEKFLSKEVPEAEEESKQRRAFFSRGIKFEISGDNELEKIIMMKRLLRRFGADEYEINGDFNTHTDYLECEIMQRIRQNADKIRFFGIDIRDALNQGKYTKVFLSNIIGYKEQQLDFSAQVFLALSKSLKSGGLFYSTLGNTTGMFLDKAYAERIIPNSTFKLNAHRTELANRLQTNALEKMERGGNPVYTWNPRIYQRA